MNRRTSGYKMLAINPVRQSWGRLLVVLTLEQPRLDRISAQGLYRSSPSLVASLCYIRQPPQGHGG